MPVIELKAKPRPEPEPFAPTATFRWAKSSPSAPPVLQQCWINPRQDGLSEWREVETVTLGEDDAPKRCELCGRNVDVEICAPGCPAGARAKC